jgi:hypothetical protein
MLIIHGFYSFKRKIIAFREDYCLSCNARRIAYLHRTVDVFHLFYVPILPLGVWKRWRCEQCNLDPHIPKGTRYSFKWAGVVVLAIFGGVFWFAPIEKGDELFAWSMRVGFPLAFVLSLWKTINSSPDVNLKQKLGEIRPAAQLNCPACGTANPPMDHLRCLKCGIERRELLA